MARNSLCNILIFICLAGLASCGGEKLIQKKEETSVNESPGFQQKFFAAQTEKAIGNDEKAYSFFQDALAISPQNHAVMYEIARYELKFEKNVAAEEMIRKALELDKENVWYQLFLAEVLIENDDIEGAQKQYERIIKLAPKDMNARFELANIMLYRGDIEGAIKQYDAIEAVMGINEEIVLEKQQLYLQLGKEAEAVAELQKLIDQHPENVNYRGMLAQYYLDKGEEEKAMLIYEEIRDQDPENGMLHLKLSEYYAMKGEEDKSFEEVKLAFASADVNIDRKVGIMLNFYSATNYDDTQLARAYELLDLLETAHPTEAKTYAVYGDFLMRDARFEEARDMYRKALELDKSRNVICSQLLQLDLELGEYEAL
ncbi:MAG: tetratricopeptide repeat protein, partial [Flavobacteriales bacterium]|nr:tetratricopeptide repeat protein [Flavobacteriales bacterium]